MNTQQAYDIWSEIYDSNNNKTRDLEAFALKQTTAKYNFKNCLEIACGTGKNTQYLITKSESLVAVDFSEKMLEIAKQKIKSQKVKFRQADITNNWDFVDKKFDFITFSLVLEHIQNLDFIFRQITKTISKDGFVYIGELHPFKQYSGSKARFETAGGIQLTTCFTHNLSEFTKLAIKYKFKIIDINEFFDDDNEENIPRIISILLQQ